MSIRWKIAALCILLTLVPIVFLNRYTVREFDLFTRRALEEQMISHAFVVADDYVRHRASADPAADFTERMWRYEQRLGTRLQVVDAAGTILFDSAEAPDTGANAAQDREIARAIEGRFGSRSALTEDRTLMVYYIALPLRAEEGGEVIGAVRAMAHTQEITRAIYRIRTDFRRTMAVAFGMAALAAVLLAVTLTHRLRGLTRAVRGFARGDSLLPPAPRGHDEIGVLGRAFQQLAGEIRRNNERQVGLLAATTHELKTPLTAIKGAVQVLRDEGAADEPAARDRFLNNIEISSDRLLRMVEQLAALSKLKAEELRGRKERVRFGAFVQSAVERLYPSPAVRIEVEQPVPDIEARIIPERIEQVLANLLDNALRYTPPAGRITVAVAPGPAGVVTTVRDTGSGIEAADLPRVFQQFFTTVPRNSLREYGSGLGLAIAQSIIQNHGGTLRVESEPGKGSAFTFTLPV